MPDQYVATDKRTGFEVSVTGEFPEHPDDRMRIARTTTLFTRLMSTLLEKEETQRRLGFRAIETQLELADALIRQEHEEVRRLLRDTLSSMGVDEQQMRDLAERLMDFGGMDPAVRQELARAFGFDSDSEDAPPGLENMPDLEQLLDPKVMAAIGEALEASEPELSAADLEVLEAAEKARAAVENARAAAEEARNTKDEAALAAAEQALDAANEALDAAHAALANLQEADEQSSEQSGESDPPRTTKAAPAAADSGGTEQSMSGAVDYIKDMLTFIQGGFRDAREGQSSEQLHFVPEGESHSVAWVLWHAARIEDLLVNQVWQGKPEIWNEGGWAAKTGLPEKGFGTGQSTEDASAVRITDLDAFWQYQDEVNANTQSFLGGLNDADLEREVQLGDRQETLGESITLHLCTHLNGHRGEINLIRGMHGLPPVRPNMGG